MANIPKPNVDLTAEELDVASGLNVANDAEYEFAWALQAGIYTEEHFEKLTTEDPKSLKFTDIDVNILEEFQIYFPDFKVDIVSEEDLKSNEAKLIWREYCKKFEDVADYNLGTILRLDSSKDYSPENTIFALRIQFYAIEIARNKQGLNDKIFKEYRKDQCFIKSFKWLLQMTLDTFTDNHNLARTELMSYVRFETKEDKGHCSIIINKPNVQHLLSHIDEICRLWQEQSQSWPLVIARIVCLKDHYVQIWFNKAQTIKTCLNNLWNQKETYGTLSSNGKLVFLVTHIPPCAAIEQHRIQYLSGLVHNILICCGYEIYNVDSSIDNVNCTCGEDFLQDNQLISNEFREPIVKKALHLNHLIKRHVSKKPDMILHCVSSKQFFVCQQVASLISQISTAETKQFFFESEKVRCNDISPEKFLRDIETEIENAISLKNNPFLSEPEMKQQCLNNLKASSYRFVLISKDPKQTITLPTNFQEAIFIQYNCARLAHLLQKHQTLVELGAYPTLISLEEADFSLLTNEKEWELLFRFILPYPQLLQSTIQTINETQGQRLSLQTHQLSKMLVQMSRTLSVYYNKVHVLVEPRKELQKLMASRIWLLKSVELIFHKGLALLGIQPIKTM